MYSKDIYSPRRSPYVKPPKNYGGTTFSESPPTPPPEPDEPAAQDRAPTALSQEPSDDTQSADAADISVPPEEVPTAASESPRPAPPRGILASLIPPFFGESDGISIGFEELLLVGLMFLVSQGERDTDTLLMLMLLLFYK